MISGAEGKIHERGEPTKVITNSFPSALAHAHAISNLDHQASGYQVHIKADATAQASAMADGYRDFIAGTVGGFSGKLVE